MACPKCGGVMTEGTLLDSRGLHAVPFPASWAAVTAQDWLSGALPSYPKRWACSAYRCETCGYLEVYAQRREY